MSHICTQNSNCLLNFPPGPTDFVFRRRAAVPVVDDQARPHHRLLLRLRQDQLLHEGEQVSRIHCHISVHALYSTLHNPFRYFSPLVFWLPVLYVFIVGLFFSEEAKGTRLLHRDQTDEWKGEIRAMNI